MSCQRSAGKRICFSWKTARRRSAQTTTAGAPAAGAISAAFRSIRRRTWVPRENGRGRPGYHQFPLRSERGDAIREALAREGIASSIFYPLPLHRQPAYEPSHRGLTLPAAEAAAKSVLSLPIHPLLDEESIERICACVRQSA